MQDETPLCGHTHHGLNRRGFVKYGGAVALGVLAAGTVSLPAGAQPSSSTPKQLAGYSPVLASLGLGEVPFFLPVEIDPFGGLPAGGPGSPSTIEDFNGEIGVVEIDGRTTNTSDGHERRWAADIRYMDGVYRDRQNRVRRGAFTFLWLDVMADPSVGPFDTNQVQIHDINPGDLNEPGQPAWFGLGGVFWTGRTSPHSVRVNPGKGDADFGLSNYPLDDYFTAPQAILRQQDGTPNVTTVPARGWVNASWRGTGEKTTVNQAATPNSGPFRGSYHKSVLDVRWTAKTQSGYEVTAHSETDADADVNVTAAFTCRVKTGSFA
jgi:hypothetical protein